jgi:hypothetical protein
MSLGRAAEAVLGGSATAGSGAGGSLAGPATVPVFRYITIANTNKPTPSVASTQMVHLTRISALTWLCTLFASRTIGPVRTKPPVRALFPSDPLLKLRVA